MSSALASGSGPSKTKHKKQTILDAWTRFTASHIPFRPVYLSFAILFFVPLQPAFRLFGRIPSLFLFHSFILSFLLLPTLSSTFAYNQELSIRLLFRRLKTHERMSLYPSPVLVSFLLMRLLLLFFVCSISFRSVSRRVETRIRHECTAKNVEPIFILFFLLFVSNPRLESNNKRHGPTRL